MSSGTEEFLPDTRTNMVVDTVAGPMVVGMSTTGNLSREEKVAIVNDAVEGILAGDFEDITNLDD